MKKIILFSLIVLLAAGQSWALSLPESESAKNGPALWYVPVYNDDTAFDVGDVLEWKINNSTGDNDNYVEQADSADTFLVAGVVYPVAIAAGDTGLMVVRGVVDVDIVPITTSTKVNEGTLLCTTTTNGSADACSDTTTDPNAFGVAVAAPDRTANTVKAYIFGR